MTGKTRLIRAAKVLKPYNGQILGVPALKGIIALNLASEPSTVITYCHLLEICEYIKEVEPFRILIQIPEDYANHKPKALVEGNVKLFK